MRRDVLSNIVKVVDGKPKLEAIGWVRCDKYTLDFTGESVLGRVIVAGSEDSSQLFSDRYDPACSCCYLGLSHSEKKHHSARSSENGGMPAVRTNCVSHGVRYYALIGGKVPLRTTPSRAGFLVGFLNRIGRWSKRRTMALPARGAAAAIA